MEDPLSFTSKHEDVDGDAFKTSGSDEDDIGYHSIGRNIKVRLSHFERFTKLAWYNYLKHSHAASSLSEKYQSCVVVELIKLKLATYLSDYF